MLDPLEEHYGYLSDRVKCERYQSAIAQLVRVEHSVMDLGCGSGLLGLMALRAGASKVLFVEEGAIIEAARRTVTDAGFGGRAEFLHKNSYQLDLAERVDIVLCDHVGYFGIDYNILALLADAKQRFLKPGGTLLPAALDLKMAPVETEDGRTLVSRWRDGSVPDDYAWIGLPAANTKQPLNLDAKNLLAKCSSLATLELGANVPPFLSWQAEFVCTRDGTFDGLLGWFDCCLNGDVQMTNSPVAKDRLRRPQAFFPIDEPVDVCEGDKMSATVMCRHLDDVLAWNVEMPGCGRRFSMTTFNGLLLDNDALDRSRPDRIATLNDRGRARQIILSYCDGKHTVAEIQALVQKEHPQLLPSTDAAEKLIRHVLTWDTGQ